LPKYNCFYKKTEKITNSIFHLFYLVLSKYLQCIISSTLYNKGYENTKEMYEKTFFSGFWVIALIDQKRSKMSFHARRVEIMAETRIM
jgi:hypothetical protein